MTSMRGKFECLVVLGATMGCGNGGGSRSDDASESGISASMSASATDSNAEQGSNDDADIKLDSGMLSDLKTGGGDCPGGGMYGDFDFSYIWIANSPQNTVSKIDTLTGVEVGRFAAGPASQAEPSRTSVNLNGDVAIANRGATAMGAGGVTKIAANEDDCIDGNGNGTIETSTGPNDVLPWGEDECVLWNVEIPSADHRRGPRPIAWEGLAEGCVAMNPRLWVGWYDRANNLGKFQRLDGDTGVVLDSVDVPNWSNGLEWGPYGGAVDKDGDFWVLGWQQGPLVEINGETLEYTRHDFPTPPSDLRWSYGIALDQHGNPWIASAGAAAKFDVETLQWSFFTTGNQSMRGLMIDSEDRAWFAVDRVDTFGGCGLGLIDVSTGQVIQSSISLPGCQTPVGISIDIEGYVWVVDQGANMAFKVDPETYQIDLTVSGLAQPYTYSDMTGAGLKLVVIPPA